MTNTFPFAEWQAVIDMAELEACNKSAVTELQNYI